MVKTFLLVPLVAALSADSEKPTVSAIAEKKWIRPRKHAGVCWSKVGKRASALAQFPGAGMKPKDIEPYERIQKDGFLKVNCIKDAMFNHGDKFGANKHEYKYGPVSNVSIVHYDAHVAKEDREKMTPEVCFNFCRTVEDMGYFGILNGRDCYCTPYFKQMASDSTTCDSVCEGDTSQMCGGKGKSNIWEMHMCNDAAQTLAEASYKATLLKGMMDKLIPQALDAAEGKQDLGASLQDVFGQAGDPEASNLMQKAKGAAGDLQHLAEDADEERKKLGKLIADADKLTGFQFQDFMDGMSKQMGTLRQAVTDFMDEDKIEKFMEFDTAKEGDDLLAEIEAFTPKANATFKALSKLYLLSEPVISSTLIMREGDCNLDVDTNCITPQTKGGFYAPNAYCEFEILNGEASIEIKKMDLEYGFDNIYLGGKFYTGNEGEGTTVRASGVFDFFSDFMIQTSGFEMCVTADKKEQGDRGLQYYPIMYFVDKEYVNVPQTCNGDLLGSPIYFKNYHGCAAACDADNQNCVGFAYFPTGAGKPNMCFLFSKFKSVQYYTGCDGDAIIPKKKSASFLQLDSNSTQPISEEPEMAVCAAKLSKFVGTNLTPDETGKNDFKLRELTKADRCYELKK